MESTGYAYHSPASEGTRIVLSYPQAAARGWTASHLAVAARPPPWAAGGGAVVAAPKHLPSYERTFPLTRTLPDPLPPHLIAHYGYKKKFGSSR